MLTKESLSYLTNAERQELRELLEKKWIEQAALDLHKYARFVKIPGAPLTDDEDCEEFYPDNIKPAEHHDLLMDALMEVAQGNIKNLMVFMPPGTAKSTYTSVVFPTWFMGYAPNSNIIMTTYGADLANKFGRRCRQLVKSSEYKLIFNTELSGTNAAVNDWSLLNSSTYMCGGMLSGITGNRADGLIVDDPLKGREEADSPVMRKKIIDAWNDDLTTRLKPKGWKIIIQCMTGDTPVLMASGIERPLADIVRGDIVATYDNDKLSHSRVVNVVNQGYDFIFKIRMTSGRIIKANARHPFLINVSGKPQWIKTKNLHPGQKIYRVNGENGKAKNVTQRAVKSLRDVVVSACHTIIKAGGLMECVRLLVGKTLRLGLPQSLSIDTALHFRSIKKFLSNKVESVRFVSVRQKTQKIHPTGIAFFALITAMNRKKLEAFCAIRAIWLLVKIAALKLWRPLQATSDFTLDIIESIEIYGKEEVYDVQIERTENFIANGYVSHNTRWHEDDLSGQILPEDYNGDSGWIKSKSGEMWYVLCLQAECTREDDPLGREIGKFLWTEWFPVEWWQQTKANHSIPTPRSWNALYQQTPSAEEGDFFKWDWFKRFEIGEQPPLALYGASDYAVTDGSGDFTEQGVAGFDAQEDLWFVDWWGGQTSADKWILEQQVLVGRHDIITWVGEGGVIRRAIEPFILKEMRGGVYYRHEWISSNKDKAANARSFQALAANGKVHIPNTPWGNALLEQLCKFPTGKYDDKVDVCGLFGRILNETFGRAEIEAAFSSQKKDPYGFGDNESDKDSWKGA